MSEEISGLIKQAKSEERLEKFFKFIGKNSRILIYVGVAALVVLIAILAFNIYQTKAEEKYSAILHQSLVYQQIGELEKSKAELAKIVNSSAPSGVKSLASLRYAAFLLEEQKLEEVKKIYAEVNQCRFCDDYVQDLAGLLLVRVMISDEVELKNPDELATKISKIENRATILKNHIAEQLAMFEFLRENFEKSYDIFKKISEDSASSPILKMRAQDGMKMVLAKGFKPVK